MSDTNLEQNTTLSRRSFIVGLGFFLSSAAAAMIWPDWQ